MDTEGRTLDWWQTEELLPPDPWAYIVSDFQWAREILSKIELQPKNHVTPSIGHFPSDEATNKDKVADAMSVIKELHGPIEQMISQKKITLEFTWKWGEYQKALAILLLAYPEYKRTGHLSDFSSKNSKAEQRQWYAMWFDWYQNESPQKRSRKEFDSFFEDFLQQVRPGKRSIPAGQDVAELLRFIERFFTDIDDQEAIVLTNHFRQHKFNGKELSKALIEGKTNAKALPPIGEISYPLK